MARMAKMMLLRGGNNGGGNRSGRGGRMDYGRNDYGRNDYGRNERGRMGYDGGYSNYDGGYDNYGDSRFRDRRGREHYDNGRYAPMRGGYDDDYAPESNLIGFGRRDERMEMHGGTHREMYDDDMERGYSSGSVGRLTRDIAEEWVEGMKNADGTHGAHWPMKKIEQIIAQRNLDCDPVELYAALNATYSDLYKFFKKYNMGNNMDAYIDFAKMFWLEDEDAVDDKMTAYYAYVVK